MRVLVTGSEGFIGSHLVWQLRSMGVVVAGCDQEKGTLTEGLDKEEVQTFGFDAIVHCSANLKENFKINLEATKQVSQVAENAKVVFLSSAAVYGNNKNAKETDKLKPFGEYGFTKFLEEQVINYLTVDPLILRLGNVYGYRSNHGIYSKIIGSDPALNHNGNHVRDFVHVSDVVKTIIWGIKEDVTGTYNVATGVGTRIKDLYEYLHPGKDPKLRPDGPEEIEVSVLNIDKLKSYGFNPRVL